MFKRWHPSPIRHFSPSPQAIDLTEFDEGTRQLLYDLIEIEYFHPLSSRDPEDDSPQGTVAEVELEVFWLHGRYFAKWNRLEVPETATEYERVELLRFGRSETQVFGYMLHEC